VTPFNPIPEEPTSFVLLTLNMGLIPFVRTSVPQANKTFETNNNILGYSKNPWDETRSCAGSSGGESGIVGSHCSPIGIGSDIGGSTRTPADWTGLATLKPYYRYSNFGNACSGTFSGGLFLRPEEAVMARSVKDVILWNQFMYDKQNYADIPLRLKDPYLRLSPFRWSVFEKKKTYKIGYFTEFKGHVKCSPSHSRAIHEALRIAEEYGHTTEEINIEGG
jgi:fatty acid amide hydrolase